MAKKDEAQGYMLREDQYGNMIEVPLGIDGENPVSPNNPLPKQGVPDYHAASIDGEDNAPAVEEPAKDEPAKDEPAKDEPAKDEPKADAEAEKKTTKK